MFAAIRRELEVARQLLAAGAENLSKMRMVEPRFQGLKNTMRKRCLRWWRAVDWANREIGVPGIASLPTGSSYRRKNVFEVDRARQRRTRTGAPVAGMFICSQNRFNKFAGERGNVFQVGTNHGCWESRKESNL